MMVVLQPYLLYDAPLLPTHPQSPPTRRHTWFNMAEFQQSAGRKTVITDMPYLLLMVQCPVAIDCYGQFKWPGRCNSVVTVHLYGACAVKRNLL
jgi:hypothetical protein